ncbi:hypothetical protein Krad_2721 [Kineococcus radiotolerans SRS30216 = ATCC BAA-149]|uniref:Uncharacterized protein n=1 Tax=Kineococcus radiotolerans (strain ATCC BAA-149 / DSM 14245 / SRS30216) TaxID=266940 RepID=A6WBK4_KINRD|nr:hypothetical protein Krad_2721 [Kineococcus radiotolerans SRS30216 = ATCC BAA-149]
MLTVPAPRRSLLPVDEPDLPDTLVQFPDLVRRVRLRVHIKDDLEWHWPWGELRSDHDGLFYWSHCSFKLSTGREERPTLQKFTDRSCRRNGCRQMWHHWAWLTQLQP